MSATIRVAEVAISRARAPKSLTPVAASVVGAVLAALTVAGLFAIAPTSAAPAAACIPRVGCEPAIEDGGAAVEASFANVRAAGASAIWFEMAVEPASPVLDHFLPSASAVADRSAFEPVSPALEHFLHPAPIAGSWAFEPVSPALEHFLH